MKIRFPLLFGCLLCAGVLPARADDWPQYRGPDRTDVSKEKGLLQDWPKAGPKLLWTCKDAGIGHSGPAIVGNRLYTLGARGSDEYVIVLDVNSGKEVWSQKLGPIFTFQSNSWGDGPRSTPTVDGKFLYALGGQGELVCLKLDKGEVVWRKNLIKDFGGKDTKTDPDWGYAESPLVDGDRVICTPGGTKGTMLALDKLTGKQLWRCTDLKDEATYGSAVVAEFGGVRQVIQSTYKGEEGGGIAGVEAKTGKLLWYYPNGKYKENYGLALTPIVKGDLVYVAAGDGAGCNLLKITRDGKAFKAEEQYKPKMQKLLSNDHGGVVLVGDHVYGYTRGRGWLCQDFNTGAEVWSDKKNLLPAKSASLTYADQRLYLLTDEGVAALVAATPKGWEEHGRFELPLKAPSRESRKSSNQAGVWTHPVVANGRLFLRDQELIFCYEVAAKK